MPTHQTLKVQESQLFGHAVVKVVGSIDADTHGLLDEPLLRALELTRTAVIVDMSEVDFCDFSGLNAFVQARREASARGIVVVIAGLRNRIRNVSAITRLEEEFFSLPDHETAVRWLETGSQGLRPRSEQLPGG
jgi:anti-sigma B factor antagonist